VAHRCTGHDTLILNGRQAAGQSGQVDKRERQERVKTADSRGGDLGGHPQGVTQVVGKKGFGSWSGGGGGGGWHGGDKKYWLK